MSAKVKEVEKIILGINPGTSIMGYGIISVFKGEIKLLAMGVIQLAKLGDHALRLQRIFERTVTLIDEFKVDEMAIEAPFYGKNAQSMLKLGRAQGVAMAASMTREVPATEYMPTKVKKAITGKGAASKQQVAAMVKSITQYKEDPNYLDATDALAVAICHHFQGNAIVGNKKSYSGWGSFLKDNPGRKA